MINGWRKTEYSGIIWVSDGKYMWSILTGDDSLDIIFRPNVEISYHEKTRGVLFLPEEYLL